MSAQAQAKMAPHTAEDNAKRRQIVEGARTIFLQHGFDAASMNDIARAAGVSKGTLYVYFDNKEQLFEAIVHEECQVHAEDTFDLDPNTMTSTPSSPGWASPSSTSCAGRIKPRRCALSSRSPTACRRSARFSTKPAPPSASPSSPPICRRKIKPACSRSTIASSPPPNSWMPANRRCSSRCCSISARPRMRSHRARRRHRGAHLHAGLWRRRAVKA